MINHDKSMDLGLPYFQTNSFGSGGGRVKDCLNVDDPVAANHLGPRFQQIQHQFRGSALIFHLELVANSHLLRFRHDQVGRHAEHSQSK